MSGKPLPDDDPTVRLRHEQMSSLIEALIASPDRNTFDAIMRAAGKPRTRAHDRYVRRLKNAWRKKPKSLPRRGRPSKPTPWQLALRAAEETIRKKKAERRAQTGKGQIHDKGWIDQVREEAVAEVMKTYGLELDEGEKCDFVLQLENRIKEGSRKQRRPRFKLLKYKDKIQQLHR
jgi:hypothetical protein